MPTGWRRPRRANAGVTTHEVARCRGRGVARAGPPSRPHPARLRRPRAPAPSAVGPEFSRRKPSGFAEFTRYVRGLDSMLATALLSECPTAHDFARITPKRLAELHYYGRHLIGAERATQLIEAAKHSIGQHHGPAYRLQARHVSQDLDIWHRSRSSVTSPPCSKAMRSASCCSASNRKVRRTSTASARKRPPASSNQEVRRTSPPWVTRRTSRSAAAFAAYVGVVPGLKQSGKNGSRRAACAPMGTRASERDGVLS